MATMQEKITAYRQY